MRLELNAQGTQVVGVYAGFIETDMAEGLTGSKVSPQQVAERTLAGIRDGRNDVHADERSEKVWQTLRTDPAKLHAQMQQFWDQRGASAKA